jgi:hydroxyacylglutathione hydrolase
LGHQKETNYALRPDMTKEEFVKEVLTGLVAPPAYFPLNVLMNIKGYDSIDEVLERGQHKLSPAAFEAAANETGALILDTRDPQEFAKAFVPNAINIGIDGNFAPWVGAMIPDIKQQILIITEPGREEEVVTRLARVGYDYCIGYLDGGIEAWKKAGKEVDTIQSITVNELAEIVKNNKQAHILDVRKKSEFDSEHVIDAENAPLDFINDSMAQINRKDTYYVHCAGGYRSMIFVSTLRARGFDNLVDVKGGFKEMKESNLYKLTEYVCPSTLL